MRRREVQTPEVQTERTARQRIIGAAREEFLAHGFHGVTMDDLAEGLGMSKKTIYAQFPSKSALLEAMLLDKFRCAEEELEAITSECSADSPPACTGSSLVCGGTGKRFGRRSCVTSSARRQTCSRWCKPGGGKSSSALSVSSWGKDAARGSSGRTCLSTSSSKFC